MKNKLLSFFLVYLSVIVYVRSNDDVIDDEEASSVTDFSTEEIESMQQSGEVFEFQAEVGKLMDIIIHSLYSNREIFLRELVSNAADATDKIRFIGLQEREQLGNDDMDDLNIKIEVDAEHQTLSITDKGIGMTHDDLIHNLGTLASSGTTKFLKALREKGLETGTESLSLIGQFGVGFYSVFLVSDNVTVVSKHNDDEKQWVWHSDANRIFSIFEDPRGNTLKRGTQIILHMKEDAREFVNEQKLKEIINKYSQFINHPLLLKEHSQISEEVDIEEETEDVIKEEDDFEVTEETDENKEDKPTTKTIQKTVVKWTRLNQLKPIWTRNPKEIDLEEYDDFYKMLTKDTEDPITKLHFNAEGDIEFKALLYIPRKAPTELYQTYYGKQKSLKLYVRRVMIAEEFESFMPGYLNFIKGVVDSDDLPLNVNREQLQRHKVLKIISKKLVKRVIDMIRGLAEKGSHEEEDEQRRLDGLEPLYDDSDMEETEDGSAPVNTYVQFWQEFGKSVKLGVMDDQRNRKKLAKLLRYYTNKSPTKLIGLEDYLSRMKPNQKYIYYIAGESLETVQNAPFLERINKKDMECLFLVDPIDEYTVQALAQYEGFDLMSVTKEDLKLSSDENQEKERLNALEEEFTPVVDFLKTTLEEYVQKVAVSNRITTSPAILVTSKYGWSANMERIMKAQPLQESQRSQFLLSKKTMEINPLHPIIKKMKEMLEVDKDDPSLKDVAVLMYDAALSSAGFAQPNPNEFANRLFRVVKQNLGIDASLEAEEYEEPIENIEEEEPYDEIEDEDIIEEYSEL